jgi:4-aminobutyrate aminotransferase-like enzyme
LCAPQRYLSAGLPAYTSRLQATFGPSSSLSRDSKVLLVCSGSESNDLAIRICRAHALQRRREAAVAAAAPANIAATRAAGLGRFAAPSDVHDLQQQQQQVSTSKELDVFVCLAHAYHGATDSVMDLSPYKYRAPGGRGKASYIIEVPLPRAVRPLHPTVMPAGGVTASHGGGGTDEQEESDDDDPDSGSEQRILADVEEQLRDAVASGKTIAGFFHETVLSCAGQVWLPGSFLAGLYTLVRRFGGLCVADEVQTGFGRCGSSFWTFQSVLAAHALEPDMVSMGKSVGNGYAMGALVCSSAAVTPFVQAGLEYFNSCAGTNVATAAGLAVLEVIESEKLMDHAQRVGKYWLQQLRLLAPNYPLIHDVRGQGFFLGIELRIPARVTSPTTAAVAPPSGLPPIPVAASMKPALNQLPRCALPRCRLLPNSDARCSLLSTPPTPCSCLSAGDVCSWVCTALMLVRPLGVLVGSDGPAHNVIKMKPPMCFTERDVDYFVHSLRLVLEVLRTIHPCCFPASDPPSGLPSAKL